MPVTEAILTALADAFMEVGVFVAVLVVAFGWLRWRHGERIVDLLQRHRRWGPAIGAALGVSPGCAGAILVMPLYARGSVSFGTAIAALVATMGDSSWVIMAANPRMAAVVHATLFLTGLVTGYLVDAAGIRPPLRRAPGTGPAREPATRPAATRPATAAAPSTPVPGRTVLMARETRRRGDAGLRLLARSAGDPGALSPVLSLSATPALFWLLAGCGFVLAVPTTFQLVDMTTLTGWTGGVDPYLTLGVAGTAAAGVIFAHGKGRLSDDTPESTAATAATQPFSTVLRHGAHETSFVVVWVAVAYVLWALVHVLTGFDGTQLPVLGMTGVLVGALVGLVPGCAVQIVFTGLYVSGVVPLSTLLANALSQDGDALLPLLALERHSALVATCITTVPGLVVGTIAYLMV